MKDKFNINNLFQKIYFFISFLYTLVLPIIVMGMYSFNLYSDVLFYWHFLTFLMSILSIIIFIFDITINKGKIKKFKQIKYPLLFFSLFFVWVILSTIFSSDTSLSLFGDGYRANGLVQFFSYIGYAILGISLNKENRIRILRIICYVSFVMAILNLFGNYNIFPNFYKYSAIFSHFNHYAYYLVYTIVISIFLFFYDKNKILKLSDFIIYLTLIYMLIVNDTFGCYLAIFLIMIFVFIYCFKKKIMIQYLFIFLPFIFISMFTKINDNYLVYNNFKKLFYDIGVIKYEISNNETSIENIENSQIMYVGTNRGMLWINAIKFIKEKPIFGYGLDNLGYKYMENNITINMPHNLILGLSATIGIPGMLFYIFSVLLVLIKGFKNLKNGDHIINLPYFVIVSHLISSMFGNTMYYVTPYYVIILGMGMLYLNEKKVLSSN